MSDFLTDEVEELHPDLAATMQETDFGPMIHHKFVIAPFHVPQLNAMVNRQYEHKLQEAGRAKGNGEWDRYVFLHERPYRVQAFQDLVDQGLLKDAEYWSLLASIWMDSENIREFPYVWEELLQADRGRPHAMMTEEELTAYACLPHILTIYQGHTVDRDDGWSWTTDLAKAEWFAHRFTRMEGDAPLVSYGTVEKQRIHAYLLRRGESEVLVDPDLVTITKVVALKWGDE